ncbi:MAG: polyprenyl synthetase family protein [Eubacteriaceae bacterium]|jgi:geranylgeranyl diphosphate synthase type II|nr:polyprenyl synthetase family protein [Eubacteriaceae bacterium]
MDADFKRYKDMIDEHLLDFLPDIDHKTITLYESMKYSLTAGGKRIRPVLLLGACEFCGGDPKTALPYACALEYIHTYSLIHDDLPCMDDDELRRGMKTNHIVYGAGIATLAGDGLLSSAFEAMNMDMLMYLDDLGELKKRIKASYEISKGAGVRGMVAGQVSDLEAEGEPVTVEMLDYININKTGAMIKAAVKAGADLGGGDYDTINKLNEYAENLGLAFQVRDDILDIVGSVEELGKNTGADEAQDKSNYPSIFGLDKSYEKMEKHLDLAYQAIAPFYDNAEFFYHILDMLELRERDKERN